MRRPAGARPATIADVARLAGVAKSTVSNYFNDQIRVSPESGRRIAEAVAELGYQPAEVARSMTSRRRATQNIARLDARVPCLTTVGHVSVDYIARLDGLPARADRVLARKIVKAVGGPAANVAAIAAGLGGDWRVACSLLTAVGNDIDSDWAIAELAGRGVDIVTPAGPRDGRLARALVMVEPDGRRTIVAEPISVGEVDLDLFIAAHAPPRRRWCLHFEGFQVPHQMPRVLAARATGFRTAMHTTGLPASWVAANAELAFSSFDVLTLQRETLPALPGCPPRPAEAVDWLARLSRRAAPWPAAVIVSLGLEGAVLIEAGGRVTRCRGSGLDRVDETGAADALVGTFLALWLHGVAGADALPHACAAAALVATRLGAQEMRPSAHDLRAQVGATTRAAAGAEPIQE